jgi:hypothetical protein
MEKFVNVVQMWTTSFFKKSYIAGAISALSDVVVRLSFFKKSLQFKTSPVILGVYFCPERTA